MIHDQGRDRRRRANRRQPESTIGVLPHRIIDADDHLRDVEDLPGNLRRHDIAVIPIGDGNERMGLLDPGRSQDVLINPGADDGIAPKFGSKAPERVGDGIDHRDLVTVVIEDRCNPGADPSTPHDDNVHRVFDVIDGHSGRE